MLDEYNDLFSGLSHGKEIIGTQRKIIGKLIVN
jgi:hypothetical protein